MKYLTPAFPAPRVGRCEGRSIFQGYHPKLSRPKEARRRSLATAFGAFMVGLLAYLILTAPDSVSGAQQWVGFTIVVMGSAPLYLYLKDRHRPPVPFFPMATLYNCAAYGLAIFSDRYERPGWYLDAISTKATLLALAGLGFMIAGFYLSKARIYKTISPYSLPETVNVKSLRLLMWCFLGCHLLFTHVPSIQVIATFAQFQAYTGDIGFAICLFLWRRRSLPTAESPHISRSCRTAGAFDALHQRFPGAAGLLCIPPVGCIVGNGEALSLENDRTWIASYNRSEFCEIRIQANRLGLWIGGGCPTHDESGPLQQVIGG